MQLILTNSPFVYKWNISDVLSGQWSFIHNFVISIHGIHIVVFDQNRFDNVPWMISMLRDHDK